MTLGGSRYSSAFAVRKYCMPAQQIVVVREKPSPGPRPAQLVARHYRDNVIA